MTKLVKLEEVEFRGYLNKQEEKIKGQKWVGSETDERRPRMKDCKKRMKENCRRTKSREICLYKSAKWQSMEKRMVKAPG